MPQLHLACLTFEDYRTIVNDVAGGETFESLKVGRPSKASCKDAKGKVSI